MDAGLVDCEIELVGSLADECAGGSVSECGGVVAHPLPGGVEASGVGVLLAGFGEGHRFAVDGDLRVRDFVGVHVGEGRTGDLWHLRPGSQRDAFLHLGSHVVGVPGPFGFDERGLLEVATTRLITQLTTFAWSEMSRFLSLPTTDS